MQAPVSHIILGQQFWLSAQRALYWQEQKALIVSDLHFGKTGHFRKAGIAVPQAVFKEDLQRLVALIQFFQPHQIIAVGDLFHSKANLELEWFKRWRGDFSALHFHLVKGNHDILGNQWYDEANLIVTESVLEMGPIRFSHDRCTHVEGTYTFCGHLHPGVVINGAGRQTLRLPCFYFAPQYGILPAFSRFTGTANVQPGKEDTVFAIAQDALIKL